MWLCSSRKSIAPLPLCSTPKEALHDCHLRFASVPIKTFLRNHRCSSWCAWHTIHVPHLIPAKSQPHLKRESGSSMSLGMYYNNPIYMYFKNDYKNVHQLSISYGIQIWWAIVLYGVRIIISLHRTLFQNVVFSLHLVGYVAFSTPSYKNPKPSLLLAHMLYNCWVEYIVEK